MAPSTTESGSAAALQNGSGGDRRGGATSAGKFSNKATVAAPSSGRRQLISDIYPVNTLWEMTLENDDVVSGRVYCTDEFSQSIVLQRQLVHTTLASQLHIVNAASVKSATRQPEDQGCAVGDGIPLSRPLPKIHKKALEERERKALRQAEESFRHINQKASPRGQACFDRLLKACNEVVWKDDSIVVLHQIRVDPPYTSDTCTIIAKNQTGKGKALDDSSLDRVRKIVESEPTPF